MALKVGQRVKDPNHDKACGVILEVVRDQVLVKWDSQKDLTDREVMEINTLWPMTDFVVIE